MPSHCWGVLSALGMSVFQPVWLSPCQTGCCCPVPIVGWHKHLVARLTIGSSDPICCTSPECCFAKLRLESRGGQMALREQKCSWCCSVTSISLWHHTSTYPSESKLLLCIALGHLKALKVTQIFSLRTIKNILKRSKLAFVGCIWISILTQGDVGWRQRDACVPCAASVHHGCCPRSQKAPAL